MRLRRLGRPVGLVAIRRASLLATCACAAVLLGGWTTHQARLRPPEACSPADTRDRATLTSHRPGQGYYWRFCGPASAVFRMNGTLYRIRGGHCSPLQPPGTTRQSLSSVDIGQLSSGRAPPGRGIDFHWEPAATGPGQVTVSKAVIHIPGRRVGAGGTAIVGKALNGGNFLLYSRGRTRIRIAGRWTCGEQT
jgi:hypothetical protein